MKQKYKNSITFEDKCAYEICIKLFGTFDENKCKLISDTIASYKGNTKALIDSLAQEDIPARQNMAHTNNVWVDTISYVDDIKINNPIKTMNKEHLKYFENHPHIEKIYVLSSGIILDNFEDAIEQSSMKAGTTFKIIVRTQKIKND